MRECFPQIQSGEVIDYLQNLIGVKFRSFEFFKNLEENGGKSEKLVDEGKKSEQQENLKKVEKAIFLEQLKDIEDNDIKITHTESKESRNMASQDLNFLKKPSDEDFRALSA